jgi:hypothetical protein
MHAAMEARGGRADAQSGAGAGAAAPAAAGGTLTAGSIADVLTRLTRRGPPAALCRGCSSLLTSF